MKSYRNAGLADRRTSTDEPEGPPAWPAAETEQKREPIACALRYGRAAKPVAAIERLTHSRSNKSEFGRCDMPFDLLSALPVLMPKAISWAQNQSEIGIRDGRALDASLIAIARRVGVSEPHDIRILDVQRLPMPDDPLLMQAAIGTGLLGPGMVGLTLGHAVFVCSGYGADIRLLSHEFRHVHQYERAGSIAAFLPVYLQQVATVGYMNAPLEADARAHECSNLRGA